MVVIQSPTVEIRRGKKKVRRKKKEETTGRKYNVCICYAKNHPNDDIIISFHLFHLFIHQST